MSSNDWLVVGGFAVFVVVVIGACFLPEFTGIRDNAELIVEARNALPQLLGEIHRLREQEARTTSYTFGRHPDPANAEFSDHYHNEFTVEWRGGYDPELVDRWAIIFMHECVMRSGELDREPSPSNRDDEWLEQARFTRAEALAIAQEIEDRIGAGTKIVNLSNEQYMIIKGQVHGAVAAVLGVST